MLLNLDNTLFSLIKDLSNSHSIKRIHKPLYQTYKGGIKKETTIDPFLFLYVPLNMKNKLY